MSRKSDPIDEQSCVFVICSLCYLIIGMLGSNNKVMHIMLLQGGTSVVLPYCYLFLLSVFILWFSYYVSDIFCKF